MNGSRFYSFISKTKIRETKMLVYRSIITRVVNHEYSQADFGAKFRQKI